MTYVKTRWLVFATKMFEKHLWKSDILCKDAGPTCIFTKNVTLPQVFFKHFDSKNQLPGLSIIGTLVENGLNNFPTKQVIANKKKNLSQCFLFRSNEKLHLHYCTALNLLILTDKQFLEITVIFILSSEENIV